MSCPIPDDFKRELLARVNIVDVISQYVALKKKSADFYGLCPFHDEKTPSFSVIERKQFYYCFGCGANGDAVDFLMDYDGRGFRQAVSDLAAIVGMQVPDVGRADPVRIHAERENAAARRILEALELEMIVAAVAVSDAANGIAATEVDRARFREALSVMVIGIEAAKRRRLTETERRKIMGAELQQAAA